MRTERKALVPPKVLKAGYRFQVSGTILLRKADVGLAKSSVKGTREQLWMRKDLTVGDLKRTLSEFLASQNRRPDDEPIGFERVYQVEPPISTGNTPATSPEPSSTDPSTATSKDCLVLRGSLSDKEKTSVSTRTFPGESVSPESRRI
jgi:hypothetical protein